MTIGRIYLPVLANYSRLEERSSFLPFALSILEGILITGTLLLEIFNVYLFRTRKIFHLNIQICLYYYYAVDFIMAAMRMAFIAVSILGNVTPLWINIISSMRIFYLLATVSGMPVFLLERSFATYFSKDYQQKRRIYIPFICTILPNLITFALNIYDLLMGNLLSPLIICMILSAIGLSGYLVLVRYNSARLKKMLNNATRYTLGNRYQIDENLRTFKILKNAFLIYSCHAFLFLITVLLPHFVDSPFQQELFHFFMEIILSTLPAPIFICFILSYPSWKDDLLRIICCKKTQSRVRTVVVKLKTQQQQDVYFNQLFTSWNG